MRSLRMVQFYPNLRQKARVALSCIIPIKKYFDTKNIMSTEQNPQLRTETINKELELLHADPHIFSQRYDGARPLITSLLKIPEGFVIDGHEFPERQSTHGDAVFFRPENSESVSALTARLEAAKLKEKYGANLLFLTVRAREDYPYNWDPGPVLQEDLSRDIEVLKEEAITAEQEDDYVRAGMKLRAILAQTPWFRRNSAPSWEEIFINPLSSRLQQKSPK
jgi:hypothetical protein